jgi:hypothetical protein
MSHVLGQHEPLDADVPTGTLAVASLSERQTGDRGDEKEAAVVWNCGYAGGRQAESSASPGYFAPRSTASPSAFRLCSAARDPGDEK